MVRTDSKNESIKNVFQRNTDPDWIETSDGIRVESSFQRGDEETGIWNLDLKRNYIDSLQKGFPSGNITLVKSKKNFITNQNPWKILDGGNRIRSIRDYMKNKFADLNNNKYKDLSECHRAEFKNILIPIQQVTIEKDDPEKTIADMFIRLNTKSVPLSQGELMKAYGHDCDIAEIELSKKIINDKWNYKFNQDFSNFKDITDLWEKNIGKLRETKRCDNLAMMVGYIMSAKLDCFSKFDKRFEKIQPYLSHSHEKFTNEELEKIYNKLVLFIKIIGQIKDKTIFGKATMGIYSKMKIAPIWKRICEDTLTEEQMSKIISFYNYISKKENLKEQYYKLFEGTSGEATDSKIENVIKFILCSKLE